MQKETFKVEIPKKMVDLILNETKPKGFNRKEKIKNFITESVRSKVAEAMYPKLTEVFKEELPPDGAQFKVFPYSGIPLTPSIPNFEGTGYTTTEDVNRVVADAIYSEGTKSGRLPSDSPNLSNQRKEPTRAELEAELPPETGREFDDEDGGEDNNDFNKRLGPMKPGRTMKEFREYYGVPAKRGALVTLKDPLRMLDIATGTELEILSVEKMGRQLVCRRTSGDTESRYYLTVDQLYFTK